MQTWARQQLFKMVHGNNLVYNQCWEDPYLDQKALNINSEDSVLVLTSAGCNSLDYVLHGPKRVDAVDMNPRQNALLQLKISAIKNLDYYDFFQLFGQGSHPEWKSLYENNLRKDLPDYAQDYWDKNITFFRPGGWRKSFYYRGTAGFIAKMTRQYLNLVNVDDAVAKAFSVESLEEQTQIYFNELKPKFWNKVIKWCMKRGATMSFLGVPRSQFLQIEQHYEGGMSKFIEDCVETVFAYIPLKSNYFWHLYFYGYYTRECCPEYLKEENFEKLKSLVDRVHTHTTSVLDFLKSDNYKITKVSLLDHMDWLYANHSDILNNQWQALIDRSSDETKIIWRSAHTEVDFIDPIKINHNGESTSLGQLLSYEKEKAAELHEKDRVHTYGSFYISSIKPNEVIH